MGISRLYQYVNQQREAYLADLFTLLRQPSISAQNIGVRACTQLLAGMIAESGMQVEILETPGHPVVFAERIVSPELFTVLFYGHYDVQPPDPLEEWGSPPFEPTVRDGRVFARGVGDNKGQLMAHLLAVRAYREVLGELPVNVKFVFEGEEETASPHLDAFVAAHQDKLRADLVYTSDGPMHESGSPFVLLGVRGIQYVELTAHGARWDNHSGNKGGVVPNPAWTLVDLLHTMRDREGRVLIDGFYDRVCPPDAAVLDLIAKLPFDREKTRETIGYPGFDLDAATYYRRLTLEPTFNIAGFTSGYGGDGAKTIIPQKATLKMDMRLVVDQDPEDIFARLKAHVHKHAPEVTVRNLGAMKPSRTSPERREVRVITDAVRKAYGVEPILQPSLGGSLPDYVWTQTLGVPSVVVPYANADENNHAPNENLEIEKFFAGIKCSCAVLAELGARMNPPQGR